MRIAMTGGSGFIGLPLAARLRAAGHEVSASDARGAEGVIALDLRDRPGVERWIRAAKPEVVVALGAISGPMVAPQDPLLVFDVNVGGTLNLLEAVRTTGGGRVVFVSSIGVYADTGTTEPVPESARLGTIDPYSASKVAGEAVCEAYAASFGIAVTALRLSTVYGPGRVTPYIIADLIRSGRGGPEARVSGRRASMRQYVHVDDAVSAIVLACERPLSGFTPLNITGASFVAEAEIAQMVKRLLPGTRFTADPDQIGGEGDFGPLDIGAARRLLGYEPRVMLEEGLRGMI